MKRKFELVLPCYNEAENLLPIITRAVEAAKSFGFSADTFQLVIVENGSMDNSKNVLDSIAQSELGPWFRVVHIASNQGYGHGLWIGLQATTTHFIGYSHADQQCDPRDAFRALDVLTKGSEVPLLVKGVRSGRNWKDQLVSRVFETIATTLLGRKFYEINAQPKVFPRILLHQLLAPPKGFSFDLYVLYHALKKHYAIETVPVLFPPRIHGMSKWAYSFMNRYKTILGFIRYMWTLSRTEGRL